MEAIKTVFTAFTREGRPAIDKALWVRLQELTAGRRLKSLPIENRTFQMISIQIRTKYKC